MSITKLAIACSVALGAMTLSLAPLSQAADSAAPVKAKAKAKAKSKAKAPAKAAAKAEPDEDPDVGDLTGSTTTEFNCELGNKITIYSNAADDNYIALRWKKRLHRLKRVGTTTGAQRFENPLYGLIWIGIPAKGMLLDSKMNRQLANECKDAEQEKPVVTQTAPGGAASPSAQAPSAAQKALL